MAVQISSKKDQNLIPLDLLDVFPKGLAFVLTRLEDFVHQAIGIGHAIGRIGVEGAATQAIEDSFAQGLVVRIKGDKTHAVGMVG